MFGFLYKNLFKPIAFKFDAELVHNAMTKAGVHLGNYRATRNLTKRLFYYKNKKLAQEIAGIKFENPIGLSAGFDYNADLTQILPSVGFGFATVGTITNMPYEGNPKPQLGRLPRSRSLLVNKGFRNIGAKVISEKLKPKKFDIPIGISIGRSNSDTLKTLEKSIEDILISFKTVENAKIKNAYYELNISCPNLIHGSKNITFYPPANLEKLLSRVDKLKLSKPLFIKMPISEDNKSFEKMLNVILKHKVTGVIIGNLQKDRTLKSFDKSEIKKAGMGNFSGAPCFRRSNELISLAYKRSKGKLVIIGCGGVFDAKDAYEKMRLGANLVMMITGMIYEGPQVIGEINRGIVELLKRDGYEMVEESVGTLHSS